ncbi:MAG: hypothetical protein IJO09_04680 [Oscillospiraceae bacterium]|nr:hypothetical protein [Oscillospiraceae bacterium]
MKKLIAFSLALMMLFAISACGKDEEPAKNQKQSEEIEVTTPDSELPEEDEIPEEEVEVEDSEVEAETDAEAETKPEENPEQETKPEAEAKPEAKPETSKPATKPETSTATKPEASKPEVKPETTPEVKPEVKPETKPEVKPEVLPETKPEVKPEVLPETKPEVKPEVLPETKPEVESEPTPEPEAKPETSTTVGAALASTFRANSSKSGSAIAEAVIKNSVIPQELSLMTIDVEEGYLTGFDNTEIKGFKSGVMFAPGMGTIPFVGYIFTLDDGADVDAFVSNLKSSANLRWNVCTEAEQMIVEKSGNKVFFVMCPKSFEQ